MRLLNTCTGNFEDFQDSSRTPPYAILSHTWSPEGEQTYQDVRQAQEAYSRMVIERGTAPPISHSAAPAAAEQDDQPEPPMGKGKAVASACTVEASLGTYRGPSEGLSIFMHR